MPQVPKAFMRRDEALDAAAAVAVNMGRTPGQHDLQNVQEMLGDFEVGRVAGMVERDQNLVRKPAGVPRQSGRRGFARNVLGSAQIFHIVLNIVFHVTPRVAGAYNYTTRRGHVDWSICINLPIKAWWNRIITKDHAKPARTGRKRPCANASCGSNELSLSALDTNSVRLDCKLDYTLRLLRLEHIAGKRLFPRP